MLTEYIIENDFLKVQIKKKGAELCSVKDRDEFEYIWQAEEVWPRHAPNLFPIVGSLIDHEYIYKDEKYNLTHHGFARDLEFDLLHQSEHSICLLLQQSESTLLSYPFRFTLLITYALDAKCLKQTFRVVNDDDRDIPVSFGGHPAFNASPIEDYSIVFSSDENVPSNLLDGPYIGISTTDIIQGDKISLDKNIFDDDALIFQGLKSEYASLVHNSSGHAVKVSISDFPYLGLWAKPGAPFVCIEPWLGLADFVGHSKKIEDKKGIEWVAEGEELDKSFEMEFLK